MDELHILIEGEKHLLKIKELSHGKLRVVFSGKSYDVESVEELPFLSKKKDQKNEGKGIIIAPLPGVVTSVRVKKEIKVKKGDLLATINSMKMENEISAPRNGIVKKVNVKKNQHINKGETLFIIE